MGQTLSEPVVEKHSHSGQDDKKVYGLSSMQGWRISMEDAHTAILDLTPPGETLNSGPMGFFAVYDGHGGDKVALFTGEHLYKILLDQPPFLDGDYEQALKDSFLSTDKAILQDTKYDDDPSGCTASVALISNDTIYVANAGDSRTVLGIKGNAKALSFDHKPHNETEKSRICAAGGFVDFGRVNGNLALSRAIGDFEFKKNADLPPEQQIVTAYPDVTTHEISDDDEFVVVACDGIWDCLSSQATVEFVRRGIAAGQDLSKICENLMDNCLAPSSDTGGVGCDNMTVIIVGLLRNNETKDDWYAKIAERVANGDGPCAPPEYAEFKGPFKLSENEEESSGDEPMNEHGEARIDSIRPFGGRGRVIVLGNGTEVFTDQEGIINEEAMDHEHNMEESHDTSEVPSETPPGGAEARPSLPHRETPASHVPTEDDINASSVEPSSQ